VISEKEKHMEFNMGTEQTTGREGRIAKAIEKRTTKLPSDLFLWAAGGAVALSLAVQSMQTKPTLSRIGMPSRQGQLALFIGQWVPTLLLLGLYNKLVKITGSQR